MRKMSNQGDGKALQKIKKDINMKLLNCNLFFKIKLYFLK